VYETNGAFAEKLAGVDLAGTEGKLPPEKLRSVFMPFLERCVHLTIHAGETEPVENVWQAVYHLNADRIGHGLNLLDRPELLRRFIDRNIGVEMCPTSNDEIVGYAGKKYPLADYLRAGVKVTVNTDNCGISRTSLSGEFYKAAEMSGGLSLWDCFALIRDSLLVAFVDKPARTRLLRLYEDRLYDWCVGTVPNLAAGRRQ